MHARVVVLLLIPASTILMLCIILYSLPATASFRLLSLACTLPAHHRLLPLARRGEAGPTLRFNSSLLLGSFSSPPTAPLARAGSWMVAWVTIAVGGGGGAAGGGGAEATLALSAPSPPKWS